VTVSSMAILMWTSILSEVSLSKISRRSQDNWRQSSSMRDERRLTKGRR
jgi:hypothetical protein